MEKKRSFNEHQDCSSELRSPIAASAQIIIKCKMMA